MNFYKGNTFTTDYSLKKTKKLQTFDYVTDSSAHPLERIYKIYILTMECLI